MDRPFAKFAAMLGLITALCGCGGDTPDPARMVVIVRPCIISGHPLIAQTDNRLTPDAAAQIDTWLATANDIWSAGANIAILPAASPQGTFPIIPDPITADNSGDRNIAGFIESRFEGDIAQTEADATATNESLSVVSSCNQAWAPAFPSVADSDHLPGFPVVFVRQFVTDRAVPASRFLGFVEALPNPASPQFAAYCNRPYGFSGSLVEDRFALIAYRYNLGDEKHVAHTLAHEIGHVLMLPHGDGLDNDGNGQFDLTCDFRHENAAETSTPASLMDPTGTASLLLNPLQAELARYSAARLRETLGEP